jgi:hypothetical protein
VEGTTLKIRLGEHAKKVREGKEDAKRLGDRARPVRAGRERARTLTHCLPLRCSSRSMWEDFSPNDLLS